MKKKVSPIWAAIDILISTGIRAFLYSIPMFVIVGFIMRSVFNVSDAREYELIVFTFVSLIINIMYYIAAKQIIKKIFTKKTLKNGGAKLVYFNMVGIDAILRLILFRKINIPIAITFVIFNLINWLVIDENKKYIES